MYSILHVDWTKTVPVLITLLRSMLFIAKEWINIDLNVKGIIKQLLSLFLGYMMF